MSEKKCVDCGEYSRARADAEAENKEHWQALLNFLAAKKRDAERNKAEYVGVRTDASKLMNAHYSSQIYAYGEIANWIAFFLELEPKGLPNLELTK